MILKFSKNAKTKIDEILKRYPNKQAATLPLLFIAQREFGHLSKEAMEAVAKTLETSYAHVYGVATFYTLYNKKPVGKYHVQICGNLSCSIMGGENIQEYLKKKLKLNLGETTPDGRFTLSSVECLASCGTGPAMQINEAYYEKLTPERVNEILNSFK